MAFDLDKAMANGGKCRTRDGRSARIICTDRRATQPVVALINNNDAEHFQSYGVDGSWPFTGSKRSGNDLINIPVKREGWVNIRPHHPRWATGMVYATRDEADAADDGHRVACVRVEWEE